MKHLKNIRALCTVLISLLGFVPFLCAQSNDSLTIGQHLRSNLSLLDKTKAYTGYLYDQTPVSIPPFLYMGVDIDSLRLGAYGFRSLIRQHQAANINNPDTDSLYLRIDSINTYYQSQGVIPISILHFAYDKIRYDALDSGYLQYNNTTDSLLVIGPDTSHSPFVGFNVFSSAPWYGSFSGLNAKFVFPSDLFISNITNTISKIEFKTEGTDWQTVIAGQVIEVNYEDSGMKWGSVRLTILDNNSNSVVLQSGFKIYFGKTWNIDWPDLSVPIWGVIQFPQPCESTSDYYPVNKLRYYVKYANPDHVLRKPFIFVEGIDFDYKDYYLTPQHNLRYGEFGWDVFSSGGYYPNGFPDFNKKGEPYSKGLQLLSGTNGLITQMLSMGYDVILVDFARGADYIQKNAYALVAAILDINSKKIGPEENVIIGASMGGLVVRYALAYMEKHNLPHCTRLYTSFDSPHLGSNVPIGLQYGLLFFAGTGDDDAIEEVRRLNLPAAKQMLLRHMNRQILNMNIPRFGNFIFEMESYAPCYRANLVDAMTEIGWPENLRKIAITNGNISGIGNGISNADKLIDWEYYASPSSMVSYTFLAAQAKLYAQGRSDNVVFTGTYTEKDYTTSISSCGGIIGGGVMIDETPGGNIRISICVGVGFGVSYNYNIYRYTNNYYYECGGNNCINLDGMPGGQHDGISTLNNGITDAAKKIVLAPMPTLGNGGGNSSFIPAISALALTNPPNFNGNYFYDINSNLDPDYTNPNHSHFEAFKGPEYPYPNEGHIYMKDNNWYSTHGILSLFGYKGNTDWLIRQIIMNSYDLTSSIPSNGNNIYNFDMSQRRLRSLTVNSGGTIQVNGNYNTHWGAYGAPNQGMTVKVTMPVCATSTVTIENGGSLILGDNNTLNNKGILDIQSGSSLTLNSGSLLTIYDNSKLIIERGATLNINTTSVINLIGNNSVIEIEAGAILNVGTGTAIPVSGNGFIRFKSGNAVTSGSGDFILAGTGTGATQTHKIIEFASSSSGNNVALSGFQSFQVSGGLISGNCGADFYIPLSLHDATISNGANNCFNTFTANTCNIYSNFSCFNENVYISGCLITAPLTAFDINNPKQVWIGGTEFNCPGSQACLQLIDCGADLQFLHFLDDYFGMKAQFMSEPVYIHKSLFNNSYGVFNDMGIDYSGASTSSLYLNVVDILNMNTAGVLAENVNVYARCGLIKAASPYYSVSAVALNNDATLILDPAISADLGHMDLSGSHYTIHAQNASDILINNAASNFESRGYNGSALEGNITSAYFPFYYAQGNYWKGGGAPTQATHYSNFSDPIGQFYDFYSSWTLNHSIDGTNFLTTPPDIDNVGACYAERNPDPQSSTYGNANGNQNRNIYSKTGNTHTTPLFEKADSIPFLNGHNLKYAVKSIFADDIDTTLTGMNAQLNAHEQLLKHNFGSNTNKAKPLVNLVYRRMQQTIGSGLKYGLIHRISNSSQINKLINVQDTLLNRTAITDTALRFNLIKDKALALRLANRRSDALTLLNQAHAFGDSTNKRFIEKWQCFIEKEIMLHDSVITKKQFLTLVKQCGVHDTTNNRFSKRNPNNSIPQPQQKLISNDVAIANNLEVQLYPNPAFDNLNIVINNISDESKINIQIIDIVGRVMQTQSSQLNVGQENLNINIPINLSSGTYFVKLEGEKIKEVKRFVVMK